jgi:hypothetical protein
MPLPHAAYGAPAAGLTLSDGAGVESTAAEGHDEDDPLLTTPKLKALGRITGFGVGFDDVTKIFEHDVLIDAGSGVTLFKTPSGAATYLQRKATSMRRLQGRPLEDGEIFDKVSNFSVPGLAEARGVRGRFRLGRFRAWGTEVLFRVGTIVGDVNLGSTSAKDLRRDARRLALLLRERIRGVLSGRVKDKPLAQRRPSLGGLGAPRGGPNLASMAIRRSDLSGGARDIKQHYVRDFEYVSDYLRKMKNVRIGSTNLTALVAEVQLNRSEKSAGDFMWVLRTIYGGPAGRKFLREQVGKALAKSPNHLKVKYTATTKLAAGDEAFATGATVTSGFARVQLWVCTVRRGPVLETLTLVGVPNQLVPRLDIARLARIASARIDLALHD